MKKENDLLNIVLKTAEEERYNLKHPYVGSEHLFLSILKEDNSVNEYLMRKGITYTNFKSELVNIVGKPTKNIEENLYTPLLRKIIKRTTDKIVDGNNIYETLLISILDEGEGIAIRVLLRMNIDLDEIYFELKEKEKLNIMDESSKIGVLLNKEIDLSEKVLCRENEIEKVILALSRKKKCNPLLVGPAGVGKTAIVEELVRRIEKNLVPSNLLNNKVYMIEMGSLISGTKYRGEFEERLNKIIKEMVNYKKAIIFIDEIHTMVGAGGAEGAINASDILKPYLARGLIKCIGATTHNEYNNSILKDKALARRFDVIDVSEPSKEDMKKLLLSIKKEYEVYHKLHIPNKLINKIIELSDYYMKSIANPDKSIDLLDSSCAYAKMHNKDSLTESDIINTIYYKTSNPLIKNEELINKLHTKLNKYFNKNIINMIIKTFKKTSGLPISMIVDNQEVKNIIIGELKNINIINVDLIKYSNVINDPKKIEDSIFSDMIEKPYTLIIFKNIELSNKMIIEDIIKINNEGYLEYKNNEKIYFNNAIIILYLDNESKYETGFSSCKKTNIINKELVNSFDLDLRNIKLKDKISLS